METASWPRVDLAMMAKGRGHSIMAKGRLRCIGTSVRLKSKFGEGYKVSVS